MAGIGIITNPHSKLNKLNPERSKILSFIAGSRGKLEVTNNLEELRGVAKTFREKKIDTLAINGGDGTISRTITSFIHEYGDKPLPIIAVLRGGTMNMLADNLNISGTPEKNLYRLVEAHSIKDYFDTVEINTLKIDNNYGFLFANAGATKFLEEFYKKKTSALGSVFLIFKIIISFFTFKRLYKRIFSEEDFTLKANGCEEIKSFSPLMFCSTVEKSPLKIKLFHQVKERPDSFQFLSILSPANRLPFHLPGFLLDSSSSKKQRLDLITSAIQVQANGPKQAAYTIDGEIYYPKSAKIEITLGPKIRFIVL